MKVNKNVLKLLANNASKQAVYNILYAIINNLVNDYNCEDKINNIFDIASGKPLITIFDINVDNAVETHKAFLFQNKEIEIDTESFRAFSVDNISGNVTIDYNYTYVEDKEHKVYTASFTANFFEYPNIINIINHESFTFKV